MASKVCLLFAVILLVSGFLYHIEGFVAENSTTGGTVELGEEKVICRRPPLPIGKCPPGCPPALRYECAAWCCWDDCCRFRNCDPANCPPNCPRTCTID